MNFKHRILSSSLFRLLGSLVTIAVAFLLTPFLIANLGERDYGLWLLILSVLGWFRVFELGLPEAVQREIAIALEKKDDHKIAIVFSCSVLLFAILGVFASVLVIILGQFPFVLGVEEDHYLVVNLVFLLFSVKVFWDFLMNSFHGFYSGLIRYDVDANIDSVSEIAKAIMIFYLIKDLHIYGAVIAVMVTDFFAILFKMIYVRKLYGNLRFDFSLISRTEIGRLVTYAKHVLSNTIALSFSGRANFFIISHLFGLSAITIYGIAIRLIDLVEKLLLSFLGVFQPVFTRLLQRQDKIDIVVEQVISLNYFLVAIFFIPLIILSEDFIFLWLGEGYEESASLVIIICFAYLCKTISRPVSEALFASAQHKYLSVVNLTGLIVNIVCSTVLGLYFGLMGVAIGVIVSLYISDVLLHLLLYKRHTGRSIHRILAYFVRTNILVLGASLLGMYYFDRLPQLTWVELLMWSVVIYSLSLMIAWVGLLDTSIRQKIVSVVNSYLSGRFSR